MKKNTVRVTLLVCLLGLLASFFPGKAGAYGYSVTVNGVAVQGTMAELRSGQLMVSVRPFVEAMGGSVNWLQSEQRATVLYRGSQLAFWVGSTVVYQDGKRQTAPVQPYLKDGKTMIPAWWLTARLGASVTFLNGTLVVKTGQAQVAPSPQHLLMKPSYYFPYPQGARYETYYDGMGDPRFWQGNQFPHEGTDILSNTGTPIVAVASGTIVRYGWNTLGGYRVTVQLDDFPEYRFYYAHMDRYAPGLYQGAHVKAGQLLGYVGSTGEGPERTDGKFVPHLHFGIYGPNGAINPFPLLKYWERNRKAL